MKQPGEFVGCPDAPRRVGAAHLSPTTESSDGSLKANLSERILNSIQKVDGVGELGAGRRMAMFIARDHGRERIVRTAHLGRPQTDAILFW